MKQEPQRTEKDIIEEFATKLSKAIDTELIRQKYKNRANIKDGGRVICEIVFVKWFEDTLHSYTAQREQAVREECNRQKLELEKEIGNDIKLMKLPYSYKIKSPFPGEGVDYHLKIYGHLPSVGCCRYDQYSDEETDIYNKAIDDISEALKALTPNDTDKV